MCAQNPHASCRTVSSLSRVGVVPLGMSRINAEEQAAKIWVWDGLCGAGTNGSIGVRRREEVVMEGRRPSVEQFLTLSELPEIKDCPPLVFFPAVFAPWITRGRLLRFPLC